MLTSAIGVLRRRFSNVHTDHRRIAKSAVIVSMFVFFCKGTAAFKEMAVAYRYGIGGTVDAYQLALTLISWGPMTLINELGVFLVPLFVGLRDKKEELSDFLSELEGWCLAVGVVLTAILLACGPLVVHFTAGNLAEDTRTKCLNMLVGLIPFALLSFTVCITAARLQAREKHVNTLIECIPALFLLAFVLAVPHRDTLLPLMLGTSVGIAIQAILLRVIAKKTDGQWAWPRLTFRSPHWRKTLHSLGVLLLGGIMVSALAPLDQYFLASCGDGAIATFGYANRVLALLIGIGALAISRAILPILAEMLGAKDEVRARDTAFKWSAVMLVVGSVGAAISWFLAPWIIALLFQRGAFTAEVTAAVTVVFRMGLVQIPFSFGCFVLIQLLISEGRFRAITYIAVIGFVAKLGGNMFLAPRYGAGGVILASALMAAVSFISYAACLMHPIGQSRGLTPPQASDD